MRASHSALLAIAVGAAGYGFGSAGGNELIKAGWAQRPALGNIEETMVVNVVRQVTPAVVSVSRQGGFGSGVLIRSNGTLLTNAHVVGNARTVEIGLADGRRLPGQVLGRDVELDVAVVRIAINDAPAAAIGNSDQLLAGQAAIAIGNPLGLERSVTVGVVSAVNRSPRGFPIEGLVQTDAAISPGNSGGPLLDSQGRVIGINTAIITERGANGLGFAIPINLAADIADQIIRTGRSVHAFVGVELGNNSPEIARYYNLPVQTGAIVASVGPGTPAERAGIRAGDIVVAVNETQVAHGGEFRAALRRLRPNDAARVTVVRGNSRVNLNVQLGSTGAR